jgi:hypothetical protein
VAKEDFCFTYYDGDAARDKAHMSRLERGSYDDLIGLQRKVGHFTGDQARKILSRDYEETWPAQEMVLKTDPQGKYYIEWLHNSLEKMRAHSQKQKDKVNTRWGKNKVEQYQDHTAVIPRYNHGNDPVIPLEDVNGNGIEDEEKGGVGEKTNDGEFSFSTETPLPDITLTAAEQNQFTQTRNKNTKFLKEQWLTFITERINDPPEKQRQYRQLSDLTSYYLNWVRNKHPKQNAKQRASQVGRDFEPD